MTDPFVAEAHAAPTTGALNMTCSVPTGTTNADNIFLITGLDNAIDAWVAANLATAGLTGWTFLQSYNNGLGDGRPTISIYYRAASSEPASYTVDWTSQGASTDNIVAMLTYRGLTGTFTQAGTNKRQYWNKVSDAGGAKTEECDLGSGTHAQSNGFILYISGCEAAFLSNTSGTVVDDNSATHRRVAEFFEFAGGGTLQYFMMVVADSYGVSLATEPAVNFDVNYTDTFASGSHPFLLELSGLSGAAAATQDAWAWFV